MQELAFPDRARDPSGLFDDYKASQSAEVADGLAVVLFSRVDANGKHHYMVAERVRDDDQQWRLVNAKEFRHARDRAIRYWNTRRAELAP